MPVRYKGRHIFLPALPLERQPEGEPCYGTEITCAAANSIGRSGVGEERLYVELHIAGIAGMTQILMVHILDLGHAYGIDDAAYFDHGGAQTQKGADPGIRHVRAIVEIQFIGGAPGKQAESPNRLLVGPSDRRGL